jgi:hypothetical protein
LGGVINVGYDHGSESRHVCEPAGGLAQGIMRRIRLLSLTTELADHPRCLSPRVPAGPPRPVHLAPALTVAGKPPHQELRRGLTAWLRAWLPGRRRPG